MNADRIDLFRGLHHLRDNLGQPVQPVLLELHADQRVTARIFRVDHRAFAFGLRQEAQSFGFGLGADRLGFGADPPQQHIGVGLGLGLLHRALFVHALERDLVRSVCDRAVALGLDVFLGEHDLGARQFRLCPRLRLFHVLGRELNGAVDLLHLDAELGVELRACVIRSAWRLRSPWSAARARCAHPPRRSSPPRAPWRLPRRSPPGFSRFPGAD